jgi:predicted HTH domain antitoxin
VEVGDRIALDLGAAAELDRHPQRVAHHGAPQAAQDSVAEARVVHDDAFVAPGVMVESRRGLLYLRCFRSDNLPESPSPATLEAALADQSAATYRSPMAATLSLEIPRDVLESARMSLADAKLELAITLFAGNRLSLGKAAELAGLPIAEFQMHLGTRHLGPHYDAADAREDRGSLAAIRSA